MWTFALGGLVVEGGHRPGVERPAPLLARHPMPDEWRAVLVVPAAAPGLSGGAEEAAFERLAPAPERSAVDRAARAHRAAAGARRARARGVRRRAHPIQELVGDSFAAAQGGRFHPRAGALVEALLRFGAAGAGQSSWGPAVYGVVGSEAAGRELARRMEELVRGEGSVEVVAFDNRGARVERS